MAKPDFLDRMTSLALRSYNLSPLMSSGHVPHFVPHVNLTQRECDKNDGNDTNNYLPDCLSVNLLAFFPFGLLAWLNGGRVAWILGLREGSYKFQIGSFPRDFCISVKGKWGGRNYVFIINKELPTVLQPFTLFCCIGFSFWPTVFETSSNISPREGYLRPLTSPCIRFVSRFDSSPKSAF